MRYIKTRKANSYSWLNKYREFFEVAYAEGHGLPGPEAAGYGETATRVNYLEYFGRGSPLVPFYLSDEGRLRRSVGRRAQGAKRIDKNG